MVVVVGRPGWARGDRLRMWALPFSIRAVRPGVLSRVLRWWVLGVVAISRGAVGFVDVLVVSGMTTLCAVRSPLELVVGDSRRWLPVVWRFFEGVTFFCSFLTLQVIRIVRPRRFQRVVLG